MPRSHRRISFAYSELPSFLGKRKDQNCCKTSPLLASLPLANGFNLFVEMKYEPRALQRRVTNQLVTTRNSDLQHPHLKDLRFWCIVTHLEVRVLMFSASARHERVPIPTLVPPKSLFTLDRLRVVNGCPVVVASPVLPILVVAARLTEAAVKVKVHMTDGRQNAPRKYIRVHYAHKIRIAIVQPVLGRHINETGLGRIQGGQSWNPPALLVLADHSGRLPAQAEADYMVMSHVRHLVLLHVVQETSGAIGNSGQIANGREITRNLRQWTVIHGNNVVLAGSKVRGTDFGVGREIPVPCVTVNKKDNWGILDEELGTNRLLWTCHIQLVGIILGVPGRNKWKAISD